MFHLVHGEGNWTETTLRIVGPVILLLAPSLMLFDAPWPIAAMIAGAGVLWIAVAEGFAWRRRAGRVWVADQGDRFTLRRASGDRIVADADVSDIAYAAEGYHEQGLRVGETRKLALWIDGERAPVRMHAYLTNGQPDPISELIKRLLMAAVERQEQSLSRGGTISGDGWTADNTALSVAGAPIPYTEFSAVEVVDDQLSLWRKGQELAAVKLPVGGKNVCTLQVLLGSRVTDGDAPVVGLGRVLFERKTHQSTFVVTILATLISLGVGFGLLFTETWWIGLGLIALAAILGVVIAHLAVASFRCQEAGVTKIGLFGTKSLRYDETQAFSFQAVRHYHNGAYVGTNIAMAFKPYDPNKPRVDYSTSINVVDAGLDSLRDHISRVVARRMLDDLKSGKAVDWTPNIKLRPDGLEYRAAGWISRKEPEFVGWGEITNHGLYQGTLSIWKSGVASPVMSETAGEENFFPGFLVFMIIMAPPAAES